jgi:serine/threonine protein kinase
MQLMQHAGAHQNVAFLIECIGDEEFLYCMLDFYDGGDMFDFVESKRGGLPDRDARFLFLQILDGLDFMHRNFICHRDMSLENIMLTKDLRAIIIDFGMALRLPKDPTTGDEVRMPRMGICGKKNYIAPEVLENTAPFFGHLVDIWAAGIILFILLTGLPPIDHASRNCPRYEMLCNGRLGEMLQQWNLYLDPEALDLIEKILQPQPKDRISIKEIRDHPWMQNVHSIER